MTYGISVTLDQQFEPAATAVREALAAQGFGVLTRDRHGRHPEEEARRRHPRPPADPSVRATPPRGRPTRAPPGRGVDRPCCCPCNVVVRGRRRRCRRRGPSTPPFMVGPYSAGILMPNVPMRASPATTSSGMRASRSMARTSTVRRNSASSARYASPRAASSGSGRGCGVMRSGRKRPR
ncbi:hypothetical protein [Georgenia sp. SUBG003]|uniref:hypothetical protein n=1 Tax=Georgenia sp. SUBG003 TaxID=1497974 RepID=UPI003AB4A959